MDFCTYDTYAGASNLRPYSVNHQSISPSWRKLRGVGYWQILEFSGFITGLSINYLQVPSKFRSRVWKILCGYFSSILTCLESMFASGIFLLASLTRSWREKEKSTGLSNHFMIKVFMNNRRRKIKQKSEKMQPYFCPPFHIDHLNKLGLPPSSEIQKLNFLCLEEVFKLQNALFWFCSWIDKSSLLFIYYIYFHILL